MRPLSSPDALCRLRMQVDETIYSPTQAYPTEDTFYEIELETVCPSCCALLRSAMLRHVGCSATVACSSTAEGPVDAFVWVHLRCVTIHHAVWPSYVHLSQCAAPDMHRVITLCGTLWRPGYAHGASVPGVQPIERSHAGRSRLTCCAAAGGAGEGEGGTDCLSRGAPHPLF